MKHILLQKHREKDFRCECIIHIVKIYILYNYTVSIKGMCDSCKCSAYPFIIRATWCENSFPFAGKVIAWYSTIAITQRYVMKCNLNCQEREGKGIRAQPTSDAKVSMSIGETWRRFNEDSILSPSLVGTGNAKRSPETSGSSPGAPGFYYPGHPGKLSLSRARAVSAPKLSPAAHNRRDCAFSDVLRLRGIWSTG